MKHHPKQTIRYPRKIVNRAAEMLNELEAFQLETVLIPAPEQKHSGHCIRANNSENCDWYKRFCGQYTENSLQAQRKRKHKTSIRRLWTIRALENIVKQRRPHSQSTYVERLISFIKTDLENEKKREARTEVEDFSWLM